MSFSLNALGSYFNTASFQSNFTAAWNSNPMGGMQALSQLSQLESVFDMNSFGANIFGAGRIINQVSSFAAVPDLYNSGRLAVDKKSKTVKTPGGYNIKVDNGEVRIQSPNGKWTKLKAEPPGRTVTNKTKTTETRVLNRDPAVRESDGDVWRYQGTGTFRLPDGTKITVHEAGKSKGLHIDKVDIYNGNKHVHVDSQLTSAKWKTVKTDVSKKYGAWKGWSRQSRTVNTTTVEHQVADQKFKTTFGDVRNDGFLHDALTNDGKVFDAAGDGDDWSQAGREVMSGAGKGKDDKTKAYKLGGGINASMIGARPLEMPWNMYYSQMTNVLDFGFASQFSAFSDAWGGMASGFAAAQSNPYLGVSANVAMLGGMDALWGGPMGGMAFVGQGFSSDFASGFSYMQASVSGMASVFSSIGSNTASMYLNRVLM